MTNAAIFWKLVDYASAVAALSSVTSVKHGNRQDYLDHIIIDYYFYSNEKLSVKFFAAKKISSCILVSIEKRTLPFIRK